MKRIADRIARSAGQSLLGRLGVGPAVVDLGAQGTSVLGKPASEACPFGVNRRQDENGIGGEFMARSRCRSMAGRTGDVHLAFDLRMVSYAASQLGCTDAGAVTALLSGIECRLSALATSFTLRFTALGLACSLFWVVPAGLGSSFFRSWGNVAQYFCSLFPVDAFQRLDLHFVLAHCNGTTSPTFNHG